MAIKAQALADFIAEFTYFDEDDTPSPKVDFSKEGEVKENVGDATRWKLFVDGSSSQHSCNADIYSDSQLVVNQVQGDYLAKDLCMVAYLDKVKAMAMKIKDFRIQQIP